MRDDLRRFGERPSKLAVAVSAALYAGVSSVPQPARGADESATTEALQEITVTARK